MRHPLTILAIAGSSLLALSACGSDDDDAAAGIDTEEEWCATIAEVDDLLGSGDGLDFADERTLAEGVSGEAQRLIAANELVDESIRADVTATLQWVADLTSAIAEASDEAAADAATIAFFESFPDEESGLDGSTWIRDTCGVDIND